MKIMSNCLQIRFNNFRYFCFHCFRCSFASFHVCVGIVWVYVHSALCTPHDVHENNSEIVLESVVTMKSLHCYLIFVRVHCKLIGKRFFHGTKTVQNKRKKSATNKHSNYAMHDISFMIAYIQ